MKYFLFFFCIFFASGCDNFFQGTTYEVSIKTTNSTSAEELIAIQKDRLIKLGIAEENIETKITNGEILFVIKNSGIYTDVLKKMFQRSKGIEFWTTYECADFYPILENVNKEIALLKSLKTTKDTSISENIVDTSSQSLEDLARKEAEIDFTIQENPLFLVLMPALIQGENGYTARPGPVIGYVKITDTASVMNYFKIPEVQKHLPEKYKFLWGFKPLDREGTTLELIALKECGLDNSMTNDGVITKASKVLDNNTENASISFEMTKKAGDIWAELTENNINRSIAMVLNDQVLSYPTVQGKIPGGISSITGSFTYREVQELMLFLNAGAFPFDCAIASEKIIE